MDVRHNRLAFCALAAVLCGLGVVWLLPPARTPAPAMKDMGMDLDAASGERPTHPSHPDAPTASPTGERRAHAADSRGEPTAETPGQTPAETPSAAQPEIDTFTWLESLGLGSGAGTPEELARKACGHSKRWWGRPLAKLGPDLALMYFLHRDGTFSPRMFDPGNRWMIRGDSVVVRMAVHEIDMPRVCAELQVLDARKVAHFRNMLNAEIPIARLADVVRIAPVRVIMPEARPMTAGFTAAPRAGSVTSQGDVALHADDARSTYGVDGSGITVGTLSDSFDVASAATDAADDVASGDLPSGIVVVEEIDDPLGAIDEGRAMMQLIHDVAPGSAQQFHTAFNGEANFAQGILDLRANGCDVIVDDVIYFFEPFFQDGVVAQAVDEVFNDGAAYFSSAGNSARKSYEAPFVDSGDVVTVSIAPDPAFDLMLHDFDPGPGVDTRQAITLGPGATIEIYFQWDEPSFFASGVGPANNMDIFLIDTDGPSATILSYSALDSIEEGEPIEYVEYTNPGSSSLTIYLVIGFTTGPTPGRVKYFYRTSGSVSISEFNTLSGTCWGHANAAGAAGVGAAPYFFTPAFGITPAQLEGFTSAGGVPILLDTDGNRLGSPVDRMQPRFTGPDGGNTTFFYGNDFEPDGFPNFFGTSAAAPHVAAVAALLLEHRGGPASLTPGKVYTIFQDTADDMEFVGYDQLSGYGLVNALAALQEEADLSLNVNVDDDMPNGAQPVTFTLTLTNGGPDDVSSVSVGAALPTGLDFASASTADGTYSNVTGLWTVGALTNSQVATLEIVASANSMSPATFTAEVASSSHYDSDSTPDNGLGSEDDQDSVTVTPQPIDLSVDVSVDDAAPNKDEEITFTITVTNEGNGVPTGIEVTGMLPAELSYVSDNPSQGSYDDASGVWTVGSLAEGNSATLDIVAAAVSRDASTFAAEVTACDFTDSDSTPGNSPAAEDDLDSVGIVPVTVDLSLAMSVNGNAPSPNEALTFMVTVTNNGSTGTSGIEVSALLPAELSYVSDNPSQGAYDDATGLWTLGALGSGASATLQVVAEAVAAETSVFAAEISAADDFDPDSTPGNSPAVEDDLDSETIDPIDADLRLAVSISNSAPVANEQVTLTITLTNDGEGGTVGVEVTGLLPSELSFVSSNPSQGTYNEISGLWDVGALADDAVATLEIVASAISPDASTFSAEVTASGAWDDDSTPDNNQPAEDDQDRVDIDPATSDVALTKTASTESVTLGGLLDWTMTVTNNGPADASGVEVSDALPANVTFIAAVPGQGTHQVVSDVLTWDVGSLANGASAQILVMVSVDSVPSGGVIENTATVDGAYFEEDDADNQDSASTELVIGDGGLYLAKGKFQIDWKAHNGGDARDKLQLAGQLNTNGLLGNPGNATAGVSVGGEQVAAAGGLEVRSGRLTARGANPTQKVSLSAKGGKYGFSYSEADLRTAIGLADESGAGTVALPIDVTVSNAGLMVERASGVFDFEYTSKQGKKTTGKFSFKKNDTASGAFLISKLKVSEKNGAHILSFKAVLEALGAGGVTPNGGDVVLMIGTADPVVLPLAQFSQKGAGASATYSLNKNAAAELKKLAISNKSKALQVTTNGLTGTGIPLSPGAVESPLLIRLEVPTAGGTEVFQTVIELKRSSGTSTKWSL